MQGRLKLSNDINDFLLLALFLNFNSLCDKIYFVINIAIQFHFS